MASPQPQSPAHTRCSRPPPPITTLGSLPSTRSAAVRMEILRLCARLERLRRQERYDRSGRNLLMLQRRVSCVNFSTVRRRPNPTITAQLQVVHVSPASRAGLHTPLCPTSWDGMARPSALVSQRARRAFGACGDRAPVFFHRVCTPPPGGVCTAEVLLSHDYAGGRRAPPADDTRGGG